MFIQLFNFPNRFHIYKNHTGPCSCQVLLTQFSYVESHKLLDGRLIISSVAVGFSIFALAWDWLYPFPQSR